MSYAGRAGRFGLAATAAGDSGTHLIALLGRPSRGEHERVLIIAALGKSGTWPEGPTAVRVHFSDAMTGLAAANSARSGWRDPRMRRRDRLRQAPEPGDRRCLPGRGRLRGSDDVRLRLDGARRRGATTGLRSEARQGRRDPQPQAGQLQPLARATPGGEAPGRARRPRHCPRAAADHAAAWLRHTCPGPPGAAAKAGRTRAGRGGGDSHTRRAVAGHRARTARFADPGARSILGRRHPVWNHGN